MSIAEVIALSDAQLQAEVPARTRNRPGLFIDDACVTPRSITAVLIICGNCDGDRPNPRKTLLDTKGNCATCGGGSYVLASQLFGGFYASDR